jgi:phosphoribosylformylglycinamidine cyclo-ligase
MSKSKKAYAAAGVDVDLGNRVKKGIQALVKGTHGPEVLGKIGGFGGLFRPNFRGMKDPVLVSSADGVGTKLKLAFQTWSPRHRWPGSRQPLHRRHRSDRREAAVLPRLTSARKSSSRKCFNSCSRDLPRRAKRASAPLSAAKPRRCRACTIRANTIWFGTIVGVVDRPKIIDGSTIKPGDVVIGLPSNGLHTNGYTLARKVLFEKMSLDVKSKLPGVKGTLADELLRVHRNYQPLLASLPQPMIKGLAHITGGGLVDNFPRVLPKSCDAVIDCDTWTVPAIFPAHSKGWGS